jgi:hypothetical protein
MRKLLLAAAAIGALASSTAMAQNTPPNDPNGTAGVNDKMNSSSTQGGAMGANPAPGTAADAPSVTQAAPKEGPNFIQVHGFLGMGTHYVAVNPTAVMVSYDAENKVGAGIQVRRPVDRQQELSGKSAERSSNTPFRPNVEDKEEHRHVKLERLGLDVYNGQKAKMGKIEDVAFDASKQRLGGRP